MEMKVLHVLGELNPSGAETMLCAAGTSLKKFNIDCEILSTGIQLGPYSDELVNAGYSIHHIAFRKSPLFFWKYFKHLRINSYDTIHLHTERANFWLGILALLSGSRCVRTIHNTFPFTGFLGWTRKWQRQLLDRLGLTHISISQSVHDTESKHYKLQTPIIQNWYNSERFKLTTQHQRIKARADLNLTGDDFVFLTIGNCSSVKNHIALIKALASLEQLSWVYLHVGIEKDCSERYLAEQLGIAEKIRFYGLQSDILPFLQAADLFVMPSIYEGFGIAAIEAIATGLPALLAEVSGLIDFKPIFSDLFYCEPNEEAIAKVLPDIIISSREAINQRAIENSNIAEKLYGIERGLSKYIDFYKN
ncbi:glycosyltransferase [Methylomonas sp. 2BW1-5-20]|uniref:glycosyltransferase n=1 Tax=Methylomonas sp. 2BW1-5-20 TaxID=3376686 RepID=UPI0040503C6F